MRLIKVMCKNEPKSTALRKMHRDIVNNILNKVASAVADEVGTMLCALEEVATNRDEPEEAKGARNE